MREKANSLSVWELDRLLEPMHRYREPKLANARERPHFLPMLAFAYRNRFTICQQFRRRFSHILKSDRTARRHLTEMEALGWLGTMPTRGTSPLWPKTYFTTPRGTRRLRRELESRGKSGDVICRDRFRRDGYSADHILHELQITEVLLTVWEVVKRTPELSLLKTERRSIPSSPALELSLRDRNSRLEPDALFLVRHRSQGIMCHFLEIDRGSMTARQLGVKFRRYSIWLQSERGRGFLIDLYRQFGACHPRATCRITVVATDSADSLNRRRLIERCAAQFEAIGPMLSVVGATCLKGGDS